MPMPRVVSGTAPSATVFNTLAAEIDNLGVRCKVYRTSSLSGIVTTTDLIVPWQAVQYDTFAATSTPMWSSATPNYVTIQAGGVYDLAMQERWSPTGGNGTGQRAGKIMVNGSSVFANSVCSDKRAADASNEGVTVQTHAVVPLPAGTLIYTNFWQSSGSTITGLHTDYGGTWLSVKRLGPL